MRKSSQMFECTTGQHGNKFIHGCGYKRFRCVLLKLMYSCLNVLCKGSEIFVVMIWWRPRLLWIWTFSLFVLCAAWTLFDFVFCVSARPRSMSLCAVSQPLPLLVPSGPRSTVHSSMLPNGSNIFLTSVSVCCFPSMPTNSFLSSKGKEIAKMGEGEKMGG